MIIKTIENISDPCRIFVRPSGTEPVLRILVEAENHALVNYLSEIMLKKLNHIIKINRI